MSHTGMGYWITKKPLGTLVKASEFRSIEVKLVECDIALTSIEAISNTSFKARTDFFELSTGTIDLTRFFATAVGYYPLIGK